MSSENKLRTVCIFYSKGDGRGPVCNLYVKFSGCISAVFYYFYTVGSIIEVKRKGVDCTEMAHGRAKWPVRVNMVGVHKMRNLMSI
jgi:hypothetical protein